jgi:clan AA aspartic protease (TIGR02281 family)
MEHVPLLNIWISIATKLFFYTFVTIPLLISCAAAEPTPNPRNVDAWCAKVDKPSSIVICSDDELRVQAIMRNQAFATLKTRLSPEQYRALLDDQTRWVNAYSARCGIYSNQPVPTPMPSSVIGCFRSEGESRLSYLQHYDATKLPPGSGAPPSPSRIEGPGFDCSKANQPLAKLICADDELSRIDLYLNKAYDAYQNTLDAGAKKRLLREENEFIRSVIATCPLPTIGDLNEGAADTLEARRCVARAYSDRTAALKKLAPNAAATVDSPATTQQSSIPSTEKTTDHARSELAAIRVPTVATKNDEILVQGSINGRPVTFEVDRGASSINIPLAIAEKIPLGSPTDVARVGFADGRTTEYLVYQITSLRIGDAEIHDVRATVGGNGDTVLLGRTALNKFAGWAVDTQHGALLLFQSERKLQSPATAPASLPAPSVLGKLPTQVGQCTTTKIAAIGSRFGEPLKPPTGSLDTSGTSIKFTNNGFQVSYDFVPAIAQSRVGDEVLLCLESLPKDCPPGDERGKEYSATNLKTGGKWVLPDAQHMCGGA